MNFFIDRRIMENLDRRILGVVFMFFIIGLLNLSSANPEFWTRQLYSVALGILVMIILTVMDYRQLERAGYYIFGFTFALLLSTFVIGTEIAGTKAWIIIGGFSLQPSEFMKLGAILAIARFFNRDGGMPPYSLRYLRVPMVLGGLPIVVIALEPDLGTSLVIFLIISTMVLFVGLSRKTVVGLAIAAIIMLPVSWNFLQPHQKNRIMNFTNPERDPLNTGYNVIQSKIAIGSGGIMGKGFLSGSQTHLSYVPEQHTDFIFSVFGEEWGFMGTMFLLSMYIVIIMWALGVAGRAKDRFGSIVAIGIAALIFWHTTINIAMTLGLFPVIGVPLPFLSYGGSYMLTTLAGIGILLGIDARRLIHT